MKSFSKLSDKSHGCVFHVKGSCKKRLKGQGSIINISSIMRNIACKIITYSALKAAIEGMAGALAVELSPKGIRVNCIAPGFTTDMSISLNGDKERMKKFCQTPMGKLGKPSILLMRPFSGIRCSKIYNGVVLPVDGEPDWILWVCWLTSA
jgi:NAD(P)-dependent dehydrogenase (short-subunit alcohol dehydrogenase family)